MLQKRDNVFMLVLLLVQAVVVFYTFREVLSTGNEFLLVNSWDGLKNYFTYYAYLKQPESSPFFHFAWHNYPFGENILYLDNTPLLALLVKAFSRWVYDITPYSLVLHNAFMVGGIVLSSVILYRIFRLLYTPQAMALAASLLLPWVSPQVLRLQLGHYNLSFSWVLLLVVYLLLKLFSHFPNRRKTLQLSAALVTTLVFSSFLHMYYLLLNLAFIGFFFLFWFVRHFLKKREISGLLLVLGIINVLLPPALVMGIIRLLDKNYLLRRSVAEGYDRLDWKLNLEAFTAYYPFNTVKFKFLKFGNPPYESYNYMGSFFIAAMLAGLLFWAWKMYRKKQNGYVWSAVPEVANTRMRAFLWLFGLAALGCGFIAMGEVYYFFDGQVKFTNYFNLFFYIHKFSDIVTQFRVLSRFAWIIFWFGNIAAVCLLAAIWKQQSWPIWLRLLPAGLFVLLALDARDFRRHLAEIKAPNVMSHPSHLQFMKDLARGTDPRQYQAILPIPFYHEGSEDYDISLFPDDEFYRGTIQLSEVTGLPIMASKLSRTPPEQVRQLLSIFLEERPATALTNALNNKPVLVLYNSAYYNGKNTFYKDLTREPALTVYQNGETLPAVKGWEVLAEKDDYILYKAYLK